ncbi:ABC transporter substrate-binding protein, partial [Klebsiella pneumoniae]
MSYQRMLHSLVVSTGLLGVVVFGWSGAAFAQNFQQAPNLDEKVKAGKLPSVNERLPEHPFVETMVDGVGKYGGTLRTTILANGDQYNL